MHQYHSGFKHQPHVLYQFESQFRSFYSPTITLHCMHTVDQVLPEETAVVLHLMPISPAEKWRWAAKYAIKFLERGV